MKNTTNAVSKRVKNRFFLPMLLLVFFGATLAVSLAAPFTKTTYAAVQEQSSQEDRTILMALLDCIPRMNWRANASAEATNKSDASGIMKGISGDSKVPVGYEIAAGDGNASCSKLSLNRALGFIERSPEWFFNQIYDLGDSYEIEEKVWYKGRALYEGSDADKANEDVNKKLVNNINNLLKNKDAGIGDKEKQRRLARAFWMCNEEVPDGQRPTRTNSKIGDKTYQLREGKKSDSQISVGFDLERSNGKFECGTLLKWGDKAEMAAALAAFPPGSDSGSGGGSAGGSDDLDAGCEASGLLAWLACPLTTALTTAAGKLDDMINTLLTVNTRTLFCPNKNGLQCKDATSENVKSSIAYYKAWSSFRTIALGLIVIVSLVVIISTAFGYEILDAYTIRKILPRLLIAIIFITLSWSILSFLITLTNDVGNGIRALIYKPFIESGIGGGDVGVGANLSLTALLSVSALLTLTPMGLLSFVVTALLAVLVAFFTLVLRELIIIILVLMAPLAIACLVLPNTRKMWQLWQNTLTAMLVVFPIISALIATGRVFSGTITTNDGDLINQVIALVAYIAPYFMIPFAFRAAGGLMATLAGLANDRSRGGFDRLKKYREGEREYKQDRNQRRIIQTRSNLNNKLLAAGSNQNNGAVGRWAARRAGRVVGGRNIEAAASAKRAAVSKEMNDQIATGDDGEIRALSAIESSEFTDTDGTIKYKTLGGGEVTAAQRERAKARWGNDSFAQQASLAYEMRKASSEEDVRSVADNYQEVASGWGMNKGQATGAWVGAAFEHQNSHLEFKNMRAAGDKLEAGQSMQMDNSSYGKFVNEVYEKRGSYNMSQMGSNTFQELKNAHHETQRVLNDPTSSAEARRTAQDQQNKIAAVAQTFMHEGGVGPAARTEEGEPIEGAGGPRRQVGSQGSAHTAERVYELAELTGVLKEAPKGNHDYGHTVDKNKNDIPNTRKQN